MNETCSSEEHIYSYVEKINIVTVIVLLLVALLVGAIIATAGRKDVGERLPPSSAANGEDNASQQ
jgi:hypothetical protein